MHAAMSHRSQPIMHLLLPHSICSLRLKPLCLCSNWQS